MRTAPTANPGQPVPDPRMHPGGDAQPRGLLVSVLHQRPDVPRSEVAEAAGRRPAPALPSWQPRATTSGICFLFTFQTFQRADTADTGEHGPRLAQVQKCILNFLPNGPWCT
jgi:hypothetical protein